MVVPMVPDDRMDMDDSKDMDDRKDKDDRIGIL